MRSCSFQLVQFDNARVSQAAPPREPLTNVRLACSKAVGDVSSCPTAEARHSDRFRDRPTRSKLDSGLATLQRRVVAVNGHSPSRPSATLQWCFVLAIGTGSLPRLCALPTFAACRDEPLIHPVTVAYDVPKALPAHLMRPAISLHGGFQQFRLGRRLHQASANGLASGSALSAQPPL